MNEVDIIIPVYRGIEHTRRCLESVLSSRTKTVREIIVIDDASDDTALTQYLESLGSAITLFRNVKNMGFVATVNRGMSLHPDRDVVLLNSDAEVADDWLDRLSACAWSEPEIGTATPFSNNATICSYPRFMEDNPLPESLGVGELDHLFKRINAGKKAYIPTAVGFCMYIRRDCLNEIGLFDAETFGKGYGEENDFCMRAAQKGWRHVLCADTFVYHAGGVSFSDGQHDRKAAAMEILRKIHPEYETMVAAHVEEDPAGQFRRSVDLYRNLGKGPVVLFVTHNWGGGTEKHVMELSKLLKDQAGILILRPHGCDSLALSGRLPETTLYFDQEAGYQDLIATLQIFGVRRVHYHHLIALPESVREIARELGVPHDFTVHDYYAFCPRIQLTNLLTQYCGEPDAEGCQNCLKISPSQGEADILAWRRKHGALLTSAERVFAPSLDAQSRTNRYLPGVKTIYAPHPDSLTHDLYGNPSPKGLDQSEPLRIVVLGALTPAKGADLFAGCAKDAKNRSLPLEFHLLGQPYRALEESSALKLHGPYGADMLAELLAAISPHIAWFSAIWPETYSYTLSECMKEKLPVAVPDLGAFPERVGGRQWSWVRPWTWNAVQWNSFFVEIRETNFLRGAGPDLPPGERHSSGFDYLGSYLN